ncbi:PIN domain-containing protein [Streptomyces sp. NPDC058700]|uniref:PIN domain-containing protein n=1 Tax=Streptomyces sp. NPDC058700 TaxID=3346607 RepID=UPI003653ADA6
MTLDRANSAPPPPVPSGAAFNPMALDRPMLLPILDVNALLIEACALAKNGGKQDKFTALALTGRAVPYIAAHVPGEVDEHLAKMANHHEVPEALARRALEQRILPSLRVVDLEIRDHLSPQTRHILRVDHEMPRRHRGDPDDAPTMALAEFLAPCVIVTKDGVFSRFGVAVIDWIPVVQNVMRIAGLEATAANALTVMDWALRLFGTGVHRLAVLARSNPLVAAATVSAAVVVPPKGLPHARQLAPSPLPGRQGDNAPAGTGERRDDRAPNAQRLPSGGPAPALPHHRAARRPAPRALRPAPDPRRTKRRPHPARPHRLRRTAEAGHDRPRRVRPRPG